MLAEVRDTVTKFLQETIDAEGIRIVTIDKEDGDWIAQAEVAEKNQYLASINPEYRVFEKEHYIVKLNANLEVFSYRRAGNGEEEQ